MERKAFLKTCCYAAAGIPFIAAIQSCGGIYYANAVSESNRLVIKKSEFVFAKKEKTIQRDHVLIKTAATPFPIGLYKLAAEKYSAALMTCTHQGCELNIGGSMYTCPCHGSEFSNEGKVLQGPADKDLKTFKTETDHENIYIYLA